MSDPGVPYMPLEDVIGLLKGRDEEIARLTAEVERMRPVVDAALDAVTTDDALDKAIRDDAETAEALHAAEVAFSRMREAIRALEGEL